MKKKLLFLLPSLKLGGGAPKVASSLILNLAKKYDISILTLSHYQKIYPFVGKYYSIKEKHKIIAAFLRFFKLSNIIKSISPDIIFTTMNYTSFWIIPIKYLFKINAPLIININTNPNSHYKKKFYFKFLIRFLYPLKKVEAIAPVSNGIKEILVNNYKIDKTKIIPIYTGIDLRKIKQFSKEKIDDYESMFQNSEILKFITVGRLSGEKGHKYLIEAFAKVKKEIPNSKLFILGEGPLKPQLERQVRINHLENDVFLLGFKNNPYKYISKANIFVLSSLHEGLPWALIEALACHLPIISTNCETGPKEILANGKYGILTKVADSSDLAEKMISLAKDKNSRESFSRKSIDRIVIFKKERFIQNWVNLINEILDLNN
ncbi:MAG: glycosyltransferase [Promethearchaeota archaeon]